MGETIVKRSGSVQNSGSTTVETGNTTGNNYKVETHSSGSSRAILNDGSSNDLVAGTKSEMVMNDQFVEVKGGQNQHVGGSKVTAVLGDVFFRFGNLNPTSYVREKTILKEIDAYKSLFEIKRTEGGRVFNSLEQSKAGLEEPCRACSQGVKRNAYDNRKGNSITDQLINLLPIDLSSIGFFGFKLPSLKLKSIPVIQEQYPPTSECAECKGTGFSPSSEKGEYEIDSRKEEIGAMYEESAPSLASAEQGMGEGGNFLTEVSKNMVISVGTVFNDLDSVRVDPKGKLVQTGFDIDAMGMYPVKDASPLIEPKHVDDLSGGTVTVLANNKAAFLVGAGGLKIQSAGINEISGSITNITGEQVNISSSNEVNLGGSRLNITSKALSLKPGGGQLLVDSNLSVNSNLLVQGGAKITGPLFVNGLTGPISYQETEELLESFGATNDKENKIVGWIAQNQIVGLEFVNEFYINNGDETSVRIPPGAVMFVKFTSNVPVKSLGDGSVKPDDRSVRIYPHLHVFKNINLNLDGNMENLNEMAKELVKNVPMAPPEIKHGPTGSEKDKETSVNKRAEYDINYAATTTTGSSKKRTVYADFVKA